MPSRGRLSSCSLSSLDTDREHRGRNTSATRMHPEPPSATTAELRGLVFGVRYRVTTTRRHVQARRLDAPIADSCYRPDKVSGPALQTPQGFEPRGSNYCEQIGQAIDF